MESGGEAFPHMEALRRWVCSTFKWTLTGLAPAWLRR